MLPDPVTAAARVPPAVLPAKLTSAGANPVTASLNPTVNGMAESLLTVRVPFEPRDLAAGREEYACHASQYTPAQMDSVNRYLAHAWNGSVWLRPWNGALHNPNIFKP